MELRRISKGLTNDQLEDLLFNTVGVALVESLRLENNRVGPAIPHALATAHMPRLVSVALDGNRLQSFPVALASLPTLRFLTLASNAIEELPPLTRCVHLHALDLRLNALDNAAPLVVLTCLRELHLQGNQRLAPLDCNSMNGDGQALVRRISAEYEARAFWCRLARRALVRVRRRRPRLMCKNMLRLIADQVWLTRLDAAWTARMRRYECSVVRWE